MSDTKHAPDSNGEEYKVGRGRPPTATRFHPGKSGNPRGRPKGRKTLISFVRAALEQPVGFITENGVKRPMSAKELMARNLVKNGFSKIPATKLICQLLPDEIDGGQL
jgi:Family of unknown function (DUF5681)